MMLIHSFPYGVEKKPVLRHVTILLIINIVMVLARRDTNGILVEGIGILYLPVKVLISG